MEFHLRYSVTDRIVDDYCDRVYARTDVGVPKGGRGNVLFGLSEPLVLTVYRIVLPRRRFITFFGENVTGTGGCTHRTARATRVTELPAGCGVRRAAGVEHTSHRDARDNRYDIAMPATPLV